MEQPKSTPSRSSSRKKRSTTNLTNLRLAPLSSKYAEDTPRDRTPASKSPYDEFQSSENYFARQHPSYLSGKSAPTTPSILSRRASRTHLGGGLSRRGSLYDDEEKESEGEFAYSAVQDNFRSRTESGSGAIPRAKSEGLLVAKHSKSKSVGSLSTEKKHHSRKSTGERRRPDDDWLTRTGAATNAMLQESKGQSWLASRDSSAIMVVDTTDDDEGYEEAAALSAWSSSTPKLRSADPNLSPTASRWGSRYGSRPASRRTSRRGSVTSVRTPLAHPGNAPDYFSQAVAAVVEEGELTSPLPDGRADEEEVARLTSHESFGLGGIVDRFMGFNLFSSEERGSTTEDESEVRGDESQEEATARRTAEAKRKKAEKEKLVAPRNDAKEEAVQAEGGWSDAAWLLSVASKALF